MQAWTPSLSSHSSVGFSDAPRQLLRVDLYRRVALKPTAFFVERVQRYFGRRAKIARSKTGKCAPPLLGGISPGSMFVSSRAYNNKLSARSLVFPRAVFSDYASSRYAAAERAHLIKAFVRPYGLFKSMSRWSSRGSLEMGPITIKRLTQSAATLVKAKESEITRPSFTPGNKLENLAINRPFQRRGREKRVKERERERRR